MAKTRISALAAILAVNLSAADVVPITDTAVPKTNKVTMAQIRTALLAGGAGYATTDALTVGTGGATIAGGGLTITAGGLSVASGTSALQAVTATSLTASAGMQATGAIPALAANSTAVDFSTFSRILAVGPNATTNGSLQVWTIRSDATNAIAALTIASTGAVSFANDIVMTGSAGALKWTSNSVFDITVGAGASAQMRFGRLATGEAGYLWCSTAAAADTIMTLNGFGDKTLALSSYMTGGITVAAGGITIGATAGAGAAGRIIKHITDGFQISGLTGSVYDWVVATPAGGYVMRVPTGTQNVAFLGAISFASVVGSGRVVGGSTGISVRDVTNSADNLLVSDSGLVTARTHFSAGGDMIASASGFHQWFGRSLMSSPSDGIIQFINNAGTGFTQLNLGGTSASFPMLHVNGAVLETKLGDNSAYTVHRVGSLVADSVNLSNFAGQAKIIGGTTGLLVRNNADSANLISTDNAGNLTAVGTMTATGGFVGALTGNASTATALQTARAINGTNFDGTAPITVTAAAGTLTGTTLNATVVASSLTSVGTLTSLTSSGAVTATDHIAGAGNKHSWTGRSQLTSPADGNILLTNNAGTSFGLLQLGGTTSAFPALNRNLAVLEVVLADSSAYGALTAGTITTAAGNSLASSGGIRTLAAVTVSTSAQFLMTSGTRGFAIVHADNGTNTWTDFVAYGNAATVTTLATIVELGTPPSRTYSTSTGSLTMSVSSGTYTVKPLALFGN